MFNISNVFFNTFNITNVFFNISNIVNAFFNMLNISNVFSCKFVSLQVYSLKFSELIPYSLIACILQPDCFKVGCLLPGWLPILPSFLVVPSDPGVSGNHAKSMKIPMSFQYLEKS